MFHRRLPIPIFRPGNTGHLVTEGVNLAGAAGSVTLVFRSTDLGENLSNPLGDRLLAQIRPGLIHPGAGPEASPGVNMDGKRPAATAKEAIIGWRFQTLSTATR